MKILLQKVQSAAVDVEDKRLSEIEEGLLLFVGITHHDTEQDLDWMVNKVLNLRVFENEEGKAFDLSVMDAQKDILVVSQFTLYATTQKGRRPDFKQSAPPDHAKKLYDLFVQKLQQNCDLNIQQGQFQAEMKVHLVNDGPLTLEIESPLVA